MICKLQRPGRLNLTSLVPYMSTVARHPDLHHINRVKTPLLLDPSTANWSNFIKCVVDVLVKLSASILNLFRANIAKMFSL